MEWNFRTLLIKAKENNSYALSELVAMYRPLITKHSIVDGTFDEDLHQELMTTLVKCVHRIRVY